MGWHDCATNTVRKRLPGQRYTSAPGTCGPHAMSDGSGKRTKADFGRPF